MFDFLKKPTHHHAIPSKLQFQEKENQKIESTLKFENSLSSSFIPEQIKIQSKNYVKKDAPIKKYLPPKNPSIITKQIQLLFQQMLKDAKNAVNDINIEEILDNQTKIIEKRVYMRQTATNQNYYLHQLLQKTTLPNDVVRKGLDQLISGTIFNISQDIEQNKHGYEVYKKKILAKQDLLQMEKMNQIRMIKLKQGEITSKVGELRMELNVIEDENVAAKAKQIVQKDTYSKDNFKTKEAEKFIEIKKIERQEIQRKKQDQIQKKKLKELEQMVLQQKQAEKAKSQRHAKLIEKFQAKQILKQNRKKQIESQKQKFSKFVSQYKKVKPLYQQKIEEQAKNQIQQRKQRFQKMSERKMKYNSLNLQQLQDFQNKYLELKKQFYEKKQIQIAVKKQQQHYRIQQMKDKNYKGKYRYLVLEEMVNEQAKKRQEEFKKNILIQKKRSYSVDVKQKFKPKIDENKKLQSEKFITKSQKKFKEKGPRRVKIDSSDLNFNTISYEQQQQEQKDFDPKKQGNKNLRLFKQYIRQKVKRGEIKRPQTLQNPQIPYTPRLDYLKEQRQNRETRNSSFSYQSLDAEKEINRIKRTSNGDVSIFKLKAEQFDQKARRQQLKLKYAQHTPHDQKQLEQDYLASIKAKLQILNNCK